ncbi:DMT family transporter [Bacillus salipaludis]|uniref:DMT family transporter n=1 Tax=Bacillus salipaludis TaxID=2547811 RepID=A0A4R5VWX6_9BACI|nr:DMT family transporter [Bacillus salipaludis]MDQ6595291.1 DMT family transporter [Bacillus salipaludis]TDK63870.1 DMT family transporter [Bacillus salipaludis]
MNTRAFVLALITVTIWGSTFPAIRAGLNGGYSAGHLVLIRYLIASGLFAIYALLPGVRFRLPRKEDLLRILLLGWVGISIYHIGVTFGQQTVSAGTAGMLVASAPIFTALIAVFILKERLGFAGWLGLAIGFIGIAVITIGTAGPSLTISKGAFLVIMAAAATSVLFAFQKPLLRRYSSIELTAYFSWAGTIPFLLFLPGLFQDLQHATLEANLSAIYIGIFPTAIGYVTWALALSAGKAGSVTSMLYIEPVVVLIVAWIWLKEWPSNLTILGGIIVISGVIVVNVLGNKRKATA